MTASEIRGMRCQITAELREFLTINYDADPSGPFRDLGGSNNLNLLIYISGRPAVARIYRPWVTPARMTATNRILTILAPELPVPEKLLARDGRLWLEFQGRMLEVEKYVEYDSRMNTIPALIKGMPLLGRLHSLLSNIDHSPEMQRTDFANYVSSSDCLSLVTEGCGIIRGWDNLTDYEKQVAYLSESLAHRLEEHRFELPRQMTHGDFWDSNVLFRNGEVVWVGDFDFAGLRSRPDDLALTMYFSDAQFTLFDPYPGDRFNQYRRMFRAYHTALDIPWSDTERVAMPYIMARQPLWGIARWVRLLDEEQARNYISDMEWYLKWGHAMIDTAEQWTDKVFSYIGG